MEPQRLVITSDNPTNWNIKSDHVAPSQPLGGVGHVAEPETALLYSWSMGEMGMEEIDYYTLMLELAEAEFMPAIFEIAESAMNDQEEDAA